MKIRDKLLLTFLTIAFAFGLFGYIEHRQINELDSSFQALDTHKGPSLTALLEILAATRRASIKAMEYSMRGDPSDRTKSLGAMRQIDQQFDLYLTLSKNLIATDLEQLLTNKEHFSEVLNDYLMVSEGPAVVKMFSEQERLHQTRSSLIDAVKDMMAVAPEPLRYDLLMLKSEARKVSIKLVEYALRGNAVDQQKALEAMRELRIAQDKFAAHESSANQSADAVALKVTAYHDTAERYLKLLSSRQYAVEKVYAKEEDLYAARKALIHALYPLIEAHYEKLGQGAHSTTEGIRTIGHLQIVSIIFVALIAIIAASLLARSISTPLGRLSNLVSRFGQGESISTEEIPSGGAQELRQLGEAVVGMMREREGLESSLKSSEAFARMLLETSPVGLTLTRKDGTFVDINPAFGQITGRSVAEMLDLTTWQITPQEYHAKDHAQCESLEKTGRYGPYEKEYLHRDGHRIPVRLSGLLIEREGEQQIWSVVEDITQQRLAASRIEQQLLALRQTEHRLAEAQRIGRIGNWEFNLQSKQLWWSDEVFNIFKMDKEQFPGTYKAFLDRTHPDDRGEVNRVYAESVENHTPYDIIHRILLPDGRTKYVHERGESHFDETGKALRSIGTVQDITDFHLAQKALRRNEQRLSLILNTLPHGVQENDTNGVITYSNLAQHRILGWQPGELIGRHIWDSQTNQQQQQKLRDYLDYLIKEQPEPEPYETRNVTRDGREIIVEVTWDYLRDNQESVTGFISIISDITERKQAGMALQASEARYRTLFENMSDGVAVYEAVSDGEDFIFKDYNHAGERIVDLSREQVIGRSVREIFPGIEKMGLFDVLQRVWRSGEAEHKPVSHYQDERLNLWIENYVFKLPSAEVVAIFENTTERKMAETSLLESEAKYRLLVENQTDLVVKVDVSGRFQFVSPSYCNLFGISEDDLLGHTFMPLVHDDDRAATAKEMEKLYQPPYTAYIEQRAMTKNGWRWLGWQDTAVLNDKHEVIAIIGVGRDINERKVAEQALQISQANLAEAQRIAQIGSWQLHINSGKAFWSDQEYLCLGYQPQACEANYANFEAAVHPMDRARVNQAVESYVKGETDDYNIEHRVIWQDGSEHILQKRAILEQDRKGKPVSMIGTSQDITLKVHLERELELYREHLERLVEQRTSTIKQQAQIIDQTHDSVVTTDLDGVITSWNGGAKRLFGLASEEATGRHISCIYSQSQHEFLHRDVIQALKEQGLQEVEVIMQRADGSEFPAHLSLSLLYDDHGEPQGTVGYILDISEQKNREQELALLAQNLRVANKELEAFSYSVSHDLRAPLRAIDGFSLALVEDYAKQLDETALNYLQRVRNGAQRMGMLIDDLLQLSRVNRESMKMEEVDLSEIANTIMQELQANEPDRRIKYTYDEGLRVRGDARLLRVMLENLLGNAWKFTSKKAISHISFKRQPDNPGVLYITDNGVGFDMRYADKLFGAFQRLHRSNDFSGSGVGLATVQRIVHRHGGMIWAEAQVNDGATFYFSLDSDSSHRD